MAAFIGTMCWLFVFARRVRPLVAPTMAVVVASLLFVVAATLPWSGPDGELRVRFALVIITCGKVAALCGIMWFIIPDRPYDTNYIGIAMFGAWAVLFILGLLLLYLPSGLSLRQVIGGVIKNMALVSLIPIVVWQFIGTRRHREMKLPLKASGAVAVLYILGVLLEEA